MSDQVQQQLLQPTITQLQAQNLSKSSRFNWLPLLIALIVVAAWYFLTLGNAAAFAIATPQDVAKEFVADMFNGYLIMHTATTLLEIVLGFAVGVSVAFVLGYGIVHSRLLERAIGPYAVGFQAVPIIAIAPVLIIVVGPGIPSNAIICSLIVFFPMLISTIVGLRNIDHDLRDLMRALRATRWQTFTRLELPGALPILFGGLKISATLAVIGAVVGESVSSQAGLGWLIYSSRYSFNAARTETGIFALTALGLILYEVVLRLERRMLRWRRAGH